MSLTNILGSVEVTVIMPSYALEVRSQRFVLVFVAGSAATAVHGAPQCRHIRLQRWRQSGP